MHISIVPEGLEPSESPTSFSPLKPNFVFGVDSRGEIAKATGLSALASRVLYLLFTTKGSDPLRPQLGGSLGRLAGASDSAGFSTVFSRALIDIEESMLQEQKKSFSPSNQDETLRAINLVSINFPTNDSAQVSILIVAESGKTGLLHLEV